MYLLITLYFYFLIEPLPDLGESIASNAHYFAKMLVISSNKMSDRALNDKVINPFFLEFLYYLEFYLGAKNFRW